MNHGLHLSLKNCSVAQFHVIYYELSATPKCTDFNGPTDLRELIIVSNINVYYMGMGGISTIKIPNFMTFF